MVGGIVKQVDGRTLGQLIRDEIVCPLHLQDELFLGTPLEVQARMATPYDAPMPTEDPATPDPLIAKIIALTEPLAEVLNRPHVRSAEFPAGNISATARALAKHYAALVSEVDGCRLLSDDHLETIFSYEADLPDVFMSIACGTPQETPRILGYQRSTGRDDQEFFHGPSLRAFGHGGYGGSCGFADPERKIGFGYVKTRLSGAMKINEMSRVHVMKALYKAIA
jgi:CubicO group peptidase (beta-lactamase class C family)